jgi:tetratricopeptide (TPR) repeat protein
LVAKVTAAQRATGNTSQQILARALFEAMHKEVLTQPYNIDCTELSKVMKTGHFNCVSATILFNCLAEKAGLNICALEMPGHALSRVKFADGVSLNIETTCPTWFDLQNDKDRQMATLQRIAPAPAPANPATTQNAAAPPETILDAGLSDTLREINTVQLAATVYYNIGVDLHAKKRYEEAVAANIKALYLDRDNEQARTNLLAFLNNWAIDLAHESKAQYRVAAGILDQGVAIDPTYPKFRDNYTFVFYYWIRGLALKGQFDAAREVFALANAEGRIPGNETLMNLMRDVNKAEAAHKQRQSN